jgi:N-acetylglucosaminyl-diphospho-decaprenol L-rhamnosyltransferase
MTTTQASGTVTAIANIAVVIVNYNTSALLRSCLQSVAAAARYAGTEVAAWVVDNASSDGSAAMLAAEFPQVQLRALPRNIGFTGGNNMALAALGFAAPVPPDLEAYVRPQRPPASLPDYVLLLNPDAELTVGALRQFERMMARHPRAGICGAYLQYGDGRFQHGAFRFPSLAQVALDVFPPAGLPGANRLYDSGINGRYPAAQWEQFDPFPVDFVLGAAMFVRSAAIVEVGALDPDYWMYCEEMDWCMRMRAQGWAVYAAPQVRVIHHEAQSSRQVRWWAYARLWKSRFRFYARHSRHYPPGHLAAVRTLVRAGVARQRRTIERQFARGEITGEAAAEALQALQVVAKL